MNFWERLDGSCLVVAVVFVVCWALALGAWALILLVWT
jgi:hypothetical protein